MAKLKEGSTILKSTGEEIIATLNDLNTHKAENASQDNVHGLRDSSIVLGSGSTVDDIQSVAIGENASSRRWSIAIGSGSQILGTRAIAIGNNAKQTTSNLGGLVIGDGAQVIGSGWAIGYLASSSGTGIALGANATATANNTIALGRYVQSDNEGEGVLGATGDGRTNKWIVPGDFTVNGTKNFEIPHPKPEKKATHVIRHGAVESPTPGDTLYRWRIQATKDNDIVTIDLPDYFVWLNTNVQIFVTPQGHFGNGYGTLNRETEQLEIHCQYEGEYNVLVIGTRNDDHQSVQDWNIKGVEREIGESWTGETYVFEVDEIMEVEEIKEVV